MTCNIARVRAPKIQMRRFRPEGRGRNILRPYKGRWRWVGLASGCFLMVHETRLAVQNLAEEAKMHTGLRK